VEGVDSNTNSHSSPRVRGEEGREGSRQGDMGELGAAAGGSSSPESEPTGDGDESPWWMRRPSETAAVRGQDESD
jgi:hypothetical protein